CRQEIAGQLSIGAGFHTFLRRAVLRHHAEPLESGLPASQKSVSRRLTKYGFWHAALTCLASQKSVSKRGGVRTGMDTRVWSNPARVRCAGNSFAIYLVRVTLCAIPPLVRPHT